MKSICTNSTLLTLSVSELRICRVTQVTNPYQAKFIFGSTVNFHFTQYTSYLYIITITLEYRVLFINLLCHLQIISDNLFSKNLNKVF